MQIGGIEMHPSILGVIFIELLMLGAQGIYYLERPQEKDRIWYILFLALLLGLNVTNGILPNPLFGIPLYMQYVLRNGISFITVSLFPYRFLRKLQKTNHHNHRKREVLFLLTVPYPTLFVIIYIVFHDLEKAHRYTLFIPSLNNLIMTTLVTKSIWKISVRNLYGKRSPEEKIAFATIITWLFLYPTVHLNWGKTVETIFINLGPTSFNLLLLFNWIKINRREQEQLHKLMFLNSDNNLVLLTCKDYMFSKRETDIAVLLCHRLKRQQIAEKLFISVRTVDKHIERIFQKTGVSSREMLFKKLNMIP
ncbi:helix-turn-helix transcriptional regulator [Sphingobacterium sp. ML3W]|uniref:helix-turn-helix transcriptional regulator n=1 Tax=Sphingobacterium sp. ML3W TaxID=1538644 RepID=UPI00249CA1B4|nr:helix-turn-helix transcriptional regulator [Sphingobacterium sp. ML3W]WFA81388.1 helix-turn-helix transcriptional regulator [Sphingobacterium sp. ML3W]